jgi:hypothetical protein
MCGTLHVFSTRSHYKPTCVGVAGVEFAAENAEQLAQIIPQIRAQQERARAQVDQEQPLHDAPDNGQQVVNPTSVREDTP